MPSGFNPTYKHMLRYMVNRGITMSDITKHNIGYCESGMYGGRIIIPSYDENNRINYFIARSYLNNTKMKYKNPQAQKEIIIFNEKLIDWNETVYIVEGAFDSIFIPNAIPMLGKFMSEHLFNKLYNNAKKIIIVLDPDAYNDQERLYHRLNCGKLMGKVWSIKLEGDKDIADLKGDLSEYKIKKIE